MKKMTRQEIELSKIVLEDLIILTEDFGGDEFQDSRIRNASSIMNKLFNEGNLMKAWRINIGKLSQPFIYAPRLEYFSSIDYNNSIVHGLAGGAQLNGIEHALGIINKGSTPISLSKDVNPINHKFKFSKYFESLGLILFSQPISRYTLIKYVANKAGGKHIDFDLKEKKEFIALEKGKEVFNYFGKNSLNVELHSIIQAVTKSKDILKLREKINELN